MAKYTNMLPKLMYNGVSISDITHRIDLLKSVRKYEGLYYSALIEETMTPERLAEEVYGDQDLWWVYVLLIKSLTHFMTG